MDFVFVGCLKVRLRRMTFIGVLVRGLPKGPPAADDRGWVFVWRLRRFWVGVGTWGILAEGGAPGYGISAFAYGDLKIQAFCENCGFGLIACGGVGLPF